MLLLRSYEIGNISGAKIYLVGISDAEGSFSFCAIIFLAFYLKRSFPIGSTFFLGLNS